MAQYKNQKTGTWFIQCVNPLTHKRTTLRKNPKTNLPFKTKKEAKEFEIYFLKSKINLNLTLEDLFKHYMHYHLSRNPSSSVHKVKSWFYSNIEPRLGNKKVTSLSITHLEALSSEMLADGYSINYINKMTSLIKTVCNYGVARGLLEKNPVLNYQNLKQIRTHDDIKYWTPKQFNQVINSIEDLYNDKKTDCTYIRLMLSFAYATGARLGEIRALQWNQIEFSDTEGVIHFDFHINDRNQRIRGRKNGNGYTLVCDSLTLSIIQETYSYFSHMYGFNNDAYVFPSMMAESTFSKPLGPRTATRWVKELAEFNHLTYITFHGLRHSNVCYLAQIGLTPFEIADRISDTTEIVLSTYYQFFTEAKVHTANKISQNVSPYLSSLSFKEKKET